MGVRLALRLLAVATFVTVAGLCLVPARAVEAGPSCGEKTATNDKGISIRILFAKNGTVQRYLVVHSQQNQEAANDMLTALEREFGPAGINAPPVRIVAFKPGSGGMLVPEKAVDSCGRTISY